MPSRRGPSFRTWSVATTSTRPSQAERSAAAGQGGAAADCQFPPSRRSAPRGRGRGRTPSGTEPRSVRGQVPAEEEDSLITLHFPVASRGDRGDLQKFVAPCLEHPPRRRRSWTAFSGAGSRAPARTARHRQLGSRRSSRSPRPPPAKGAIADEPRRKLGIGSPRSRGLELLDVAEVADRLVLGELVGHARWRDDVAVHAQAMDA